MNEQVKIDDKRFKRHPISFNLNEQLWTRFRIQAIKERTTATDLANRALRRYLSNMYKDYDGCYE